jgi:hypothetical protein
MDAPDTSVRTPWLALLILALLCTGLNAVKPVHADDFAYLAYAQEFALHPAAPYNNDFLLPPGAVPAMSILVPPVFPYWLALGISLGGTSVIWLHLWQFPVLLLLVRATYALAQRFAAPLAGPLTVLLVLSPSVTPGINFMLDTPVLALTTAALALLLRAAPPGDGEADDAPRGHLGWALLAGVLGGLAMQTKYTALILPPLFLLTGVLGRRWLAGVLAAGLAVGLFVGWELYTVHVSGQSHFLVSLSSRSASVLDRVWHLLLPLLTHLGGVGLGVLLVGTIALGKLRTALALGLGFFLGLLALALFPAQLVVWAEPRDPGSNGLSLANVLCCSYGVLVLATLLTGARRLLRSGATGESNARGMLVFLFGWILLEAAGAGLLSPFPATRRVMGLLYAGGLFVGYLACRTGVADRARGALRAAVATSVALTVGYYALDLVQVLDERHVAEVAVARARSLPDAGEVYTLGWCTFEYYAEQAGARPFLWNRPLPRPGDVLLYQANALDNLLRSGLPATGLELVAEIPFTATKYLRIYPGYYAGALPLARANHQAGVARLYRVVGPLSQARQPEEIQQRAQR